MSNVDEYVSIDSDTGVLSGTPLQLDNVTLFYNVSLACFTEAMRGTRPWGDLEHCFELVVSIFSLEHVRIVGWPVELFLPWETQEGEATEATAAHPTPTHVDTWAGFDLFGGLLILGILSLLLASCTTDWYARYERV